MFSIHLLFYGMTAPLAGGVVVITGHQAQEVEELLSSHRLRFARQEEQLGTGHAVLAAEALLGAEKGVALILCGDTPLLKPDTLKKMVAEHQRSGSKITIMTTILEDPANYGRIVVSESREVVKIVEEKDASAGQRLIKEVNAGIYCVDLKLLFASLKQVGTDNKQGEVYLTDIVEIAREAGLSVNRFICPDPDEVLGVNSRVELANATAIIQQRRNQELMLAGVSMVDPGSVFIEKGVEIGRDTLIHPNCYLTGRTVIGRDCEIGPYVKLADCRVGDRRKISPFKDLQGSDL